MALTFGQFLSIFTTNDASGGRAIKATFDTGVDDAANYLTKNDPAGGRAIKIVNVGSPLGPQFWTEAYNAGTQATSSWTPNNAAANVNAAIRPKGTGAIVAAIPDGTATGAGLRLPATASRRGPVPRTVPAPVAAHGTRGTGDPQLRHGAGVGVACAAVTPSQ